MDGEDLRLVARCVAGDQAACADLVEQHSRVVGTVIWRATGDGAVVEDLTQETFLRVFRALPSFAGEAKLSTWICTVAHHVAIDHVRKVARHREEPLPASTDALDALLEQTGAETVSPELLASREEIDRLVQDGLAALPEKYRLPLVYAAIEGLDYGTIGAMLGVPVGTVKTLVFRGKQLLKSLIAEALEKAGR